MAYTIEQMSEFARAHLARMTRQELNQITLNMLYTSALDFYARTFRVFKHRDTIAGDDTYYSELPHDFVASREMRVGEGATAEAMEVDQFTFLETKENSLGSQSPPYWIYWIDDEQERIWIYPEVPTGTTAVHWIFYIPAVPVALAYFPRELELQPFLRCLRMALAEFDDRAAIADKLKEELYALRSEIQMRARERSKQPYRRGTSQELG